ncbi:unnamed protein product [Mycena citricolor]|uniref:Amidohydrolase-related domain-containing protein n=1 Tax=Mycena citricolor TaxID=2018698 RepID=A0AAD2K678_9AGAR|nr:unnamed protein product [Mycena citricolor]
MPLQKGGMPRLFALVLTLGLTAFLLSCKTRQQPPSHARSTKRPVPAQCAAILASQSPAASYPAHRQQSDRYVRGTRPVLLRNATLWTGRDEGREVVRGASVLLDRGLVVAVLAEIPDAARLAETWGLPAGLLDVVDVHGKWVTPGMVDAHSHLGVRSAPQLVGASDTNSVKAPILPWLRSVDGLNTHDDAYRLTMSGGVTTVQVLPGSANNIGGQAFLMKLRPTAERSTSSMLLEPPANLHINDTNLDSRPRWRHMKHACGENPMRLYSQTRMDASWNFRQAYNEARKIRDAQDAFCAAAEQGLWDGETAFPESLQWESLVDVLRGLVKISTHCYEPVDLDSLIRLSNEFKFPIASIHHSTGTYLVPDLLKKAWGGPPTIAVFASDYRPKRETYRTSEFGARILADNNLTVVIKSDHFVTDSRFLMFEAQQAYYFGLSGALTLSAVTTKAAASLGVEWRVGTIAEGRPGYDADIVVWDSHPLVLGAIPEQVYIDGIPQIDTPFLSPKSEALQQAPKTPNWDKETAETLASDGLPPLEGRLTSGPVKFIGVKSLWRKDANGTWAEHVAGDESSFSVIVEDGKVVSQCSSACALDAETVVDLEGGSLAPGLTSFGSYLGLSEIELEPSTMDGWVFDELSPDAPPPRVLGHAVVRAVDGLQFGGRHALLAYRAGVTMGITAPMGDFTRGLGVAFDLGAGNAVDAGAVVQAETALHVEVTLSSGLSVSTQIAALRRSLRRGDGPWARVRQGEIPLVVVVHSADVMATLLDLKREIEERTGRVLRMTFAGALEAHLLAKEIAQAGVSVVIAPGKPFPAMFEMRRSIPGPPLTQDSSFTILLKHGVNVGIGIEQVYLARSARFDMSMTQVNSAGVIDRATALAMASTNVDRALGLEAERRTEELVAYRGGGLFDMASKVVAVVSERRGAVVQF